MSTKTTNPTEITLLRIREWGACGGGRDWFREKFPQGGDYGLVMNALYEDKRFGDAQWLASKVFTEIKDTAAIVGSEVAAIQAATNDKDENGDGARIGSSGDSARIGSSGYDARIKCEGKNAVVAAAGQRTHVTLSEGGAASLVWYDGKRARFTNLYEGEDGIEAGVEYRLDDAGKVVRA
ncbi:hypothetical protein [Gluconobacter oxydans]|uniref:hypothetical protein n=1 Tax=Gluconobacter oxydans TaxID=442 RepID=UPI000B00B12B|nr:hypothetical protein [Gluconobacter oxydans]